MTSLFSVLKSASLPEKWSERDFNTTGHLFDWVLCLRIFGLVLTRLKNFSMKTATIEGKSPQTCSNGFEIVIVPEESQQLYFAMRHANEGWLCKQLKPVKSV